MKKIAVVTGAYRGLGFATARELARKGYGVVLVARKSGPLKKAVNRLRKEGLEVEGFNADISREKEIKSLVKWVQKKWGAWDVLVNNAGIYIDPKGDANSTVFKTKTSTLRKTLETNTFGALLLIQNVVPLMRKQNFGRIVNVSSGMGSLTDMSGHFASYRISKTALNAVTRIVASELQGTNIKINSVCPGWVRTEMGGAGAERTIEEGIRGIVWAATLPEEGPSGGFFRDGAPIPW